MSRTVKTRLICLIAAGAAVVSRPAVAQMHKVARPQQVVRAVGVYEWTGDRAKPVASRLVPVSLYINGNLEDAGVYLARPVPFALLSGNVYELKKAGIGQGLLDLESARRVQTADGDYDSGWIGYGTLHAEAAPKVPALKPSKTLSAVVSSGDDSRPHFGKDGAGSPTAQTGTSPKPEAGNEPAGDPDRPTMKRQSADAGSQTANAESTAEEPADDPDRPTLKRRSPEQQKKAKEQAESQGTGAVASLNNDPNRPNLHYGKPAGPSTETASSRLIGLPTDLHQMVAVSDAVDREPHDFARPWEDTAEHAAVLKKMETMAREKLAEYDKENAPVPEPPSHGKVSSKSHAKRVPSVVALLDEQLKGYELSYGGAATYVFMAHTAGTGDALRYVTVVAQADDLGELKPALQSVTDEAHLNRTPQMRFIDVVDAEASNRASLLFELRAQNSRQFALYRVIAAEAEPIFVSGAMR